MTRAITPPCRRDLACYRNDGHPGDHAYATPDTVPSPAPIWQAGYDAGYREAQQDIARAALAATAAPTEDATLDVERLAIALHEGRFDCWTNREDICVADHALAAKQLLAAYADVEPTFVRADGRCVCGAREHRGECHFGWHKPDCPEALATPAPTEDDTLDDDEHADCGRTDPHAPHTETGTMMGAYYAHNCAGWPAITPVGPRGYEKVRPAPTEDATLDPHERGCRCYPHVSLLQAGHFAVTAATEARVSAPITESAQKGAEK